MRGSDVSRRYNRHRIGASLLCTDGRRRRESRIPSAKIEFKSIRDEKVFHFQSPDQELQAQHILLVGKNDEWFHSIMGDVFETFSQL
jgi:hypothetical protein